MAPTKLYRTTVSMIAIYLPILAGDLDPHVRGVGWRTSPSDTSQPTASKGMASTLDLVSSSAEFPLETQHT